MRPGHALRAFPRDWKPPGWKVQGEKFPRITRIRTSFLDPGGSECFAFPKRPVVGTPIIEAVEMRGLLKIGESQLFQDL